MTPEYTKKSFNKTLNASRASVNQRVLRLKFTKLVHFVIAIPSLIYNSLINKMGY
ncbi:hypothetical protein JCM30760_11040 [Thiomicrorhabdus hydrogeniphila]